MPDKHQAFYSSRQAAKLLGVAVSTIQVWTNNGFLDAWITNGGHRRIKRSSVEQMLRQQKTSDRQERQELSVVIVEDSTQQLRMYKKQFDSWQLKTRVVTASDGYEGLVKIGANLPDVIITDLKMPNFDGFRLVRTLHNMPGLENSLIIVVTGLSKETIKENGGLPSDVKVFTKPVPFTQLKTLLLEKVKSNSSMAIIE